MGLKESIVGMFDGLLACKLPYCGQVIKELMRDEGISQQEISNRTGIHQTKVSQHLRAESMDYGTVLKLSIAINQDPIVVIEEAHRRFLADIKTHSELEKRFLGKE
jgi:transcriptional regulator with XRE-family HTH domain